MNPKIKDIIVRESVISVSILGAIFFLGVGGLMVGLCGKAGGIWGQIAGYVALVMWALAGIVIIGYIVSILIRIIIWAVRKKVALRFRKT